MWNAHVLSYFIFISYFVHISGHIYFICLPDLRFGIYGNPAVYNAYPKRVCEPFSHAFGNSAVVQWTLPWVVLQQITTWVLHNPNAYSSRRLSVNLENIGFESKGVWGLFLTRTQTNVECHKIEVSLVGKTFDSPKIADSWFWWFSGLVTCLPPCCLSTWGSLS